LRQPKPNITHQLPEMLNTAHFYIQIEKQSTFQEVIEEVNQELQQTAPEIEVKVVSSTEKPELVKVLQDGYQVPIIICNSVDAEPEINKIIQNTPD